ncbi:bifunctional tRNA (5-methylaminomethyl-2-thiouridine)(34)-methyltransferase MnmD/FAD-dependent 5-carboxymethylaminomethyl-2-thiouridine(34) oxidoreductase MnmC [Aliikangiella coralliicola]|uniref:tRNA 5-methylaminomethyl-2-thiouridine biosynthesis bifunctional protein MnmC n=1 Tax=Aliikangiella coralliicola TaxID=2592383 RepID=A0A545U609_9GAMM|nr:bifunctional tRNA (5-methylaminomethyl-2-thiouridine)(34)-methyltransferase MnmD/FAD-dependent 5-carboxymethylaminomethyl-2-thiouridine(34) oxidoreductase MnmC [Aliikangiella coralliicola]TQV84908.1 bifunctional tRNA (5-methylaminomethyl-2-thiouridine)(34)-methyltransferase MnmD/FAD-dependent 5-carboxymethylaminomethyl-2-thiouridine(34) oxidoreductase MnmC [Aliikangiella coralliicola]
MSSAHLKKFASIKPADIEWRNNLPYSREFDDIYFSSEDGLAESTYVFIEGNQLENDWLTLDQKQFFLAELGFGSGLNFLITANLWQEKINAHPELKSKHLHYISIEKHPLLLSDFRRACEHWPQFSKISEQLIEDYPSQTYGRHQLKFEKINLTLTLLYMPVEEALNDLLQESEYQQNKLKFDHWFLDGFAPAKNESMWGDKLCQSIAKLSRVGTRLATFSVAASVKKPLQNAGFEIKKRKGFGRKREMLTAQLKQRPDNLNQSKFINIKFEKPWFHYSQSDASNKVAIIGGGLAGCATAYSLSSKGYSVDLYESNNDLAMGASGAAAGIFHPQLTGDMNINSQFNWLAYLYLLRFISRLTESEKEQVILSHGITRFLANETIKKQLLLLADSIGIQDWVKKDEKYSDSNAVSFPHGAALDISNFCQLLFDKIPVHKKKLLTNNKVTGLNWNGNNWTIQSAKMNDKYSHVVLCTGAKNHLLDQSTVDSTNTTRGQTCYLSHQPLTEHINHVLCEQVYLVPHQNGDFHIGTTFEDFHDDDLNLHSQHDILNKTSAFLNELSIPFLSTNEINTKKLAGTVGYRLHSLDRLPIIGGATDHAKLSKDFEKLGQKRIARDNISCYNNPGLWLNTAYGSHGLLYSLLGSEYLASLINNDISPVGSQLGWAIHPARFFVNSLKRSQSSNARD